MDIPRVVCMFHTSTQIDFVLLLNCEPSDMFRIQQIILNMSTCSPKKKHRSHRCSIPFELCNFWITQL